MIHTADAKPKFKRLAHRLATLTQCSVVSGELVAKGVLSGLWHLTIRETPLGNVGRLCDADIAIGIGWFGDAEPLLDALIACGWLDRHPDHRLVVHDWHDWAPNFVKGNVVKHGKQFASCPPEEHPPGSFPDEPPEGSCPEQIAKGRSSGDAPQRSSSEGLAPKHQPQPVTKTLTGRRRRDDDDQVATGRNATPSQIAAVDATRRRLLRELPAKTVDDRDLATKVCILAQLRFGEDWLWDAVEGVKRSKKPVRRPWAYLTRCLDTSTAELGGRLDQCLATTVIPAELLRTTG